MIFDFLQNTIYSLLMYGLIFFQGDDKVVHVDL
jgi:hypothetical protein